jgi:hypothetical protein
MLFQSPDQISNYATGRQLEDKLLKLIDQTKEGISRDQSPQTQALIINVQKFIQDHMVRS